MAHQAASGCVMRSEAAIRSEAQRMREALDPLIGRERAPLDDVLCGKGLALARVVFPAASHSASSRS